MTGAFRVVSTPAFEREFRKVSRGKRALIEVLAELVAILSEDPHRTLTIPSSPTVPLRGSAACGGKTTTGVGKSVAPRNDEASSRYVPAEPLRLVARK
jgi:hypothetical protein